MKRRILIISDSVKRNTGYSTVAKNIIKRLLPTEKYEIAQLGLADIPVKQPFPIHHYSTIKVHQECCRKGACIEYSGPEAEKIEYISVDPFVKPLPDQTMCLKGKTSSRDNYAYESIFFVLNHFQPDIVVPINDIWGLHNINFLTNRKHFKLSPYMAIDSECLFPSIPCPDPGLPPVDTLKTVASCNKVIVFTEWARDEIFKLSRLLTDNKVPNNISVIPHGVDTNIWRPLDNRLQLRQNFFHFGEEVFLIGSIARNQPRKKLDASIITLRKFIDKYEKPDRKAMLYFHCSVEDRLGWNLPWLAKYYGVTDRVIFNKDLKPGAGPSEETLNEIANTFDIHLSLTNSEGWGLPALETAAAGIPNIITKYSAHADWGKDTLLFVKVAAIEHEPKTGFIKAIADNDHAAKQIALLYNSPKMWREYSRKGINLGKELDWDNVVKKWETEIDAIDISDLKENRYLHFKLDPETLEVPDLPKDPTETPFDLIEL